VYELFFQKFILQLGFSADLGSGTGCGSTKGCRCCSSGSSNGFLHHFGVTERQPIILLGASKLFTPDIVHITHSNVSTSARGSASISKHLAISRNCLNSSFWNLTSKRPPSLNQQQSVYFLQEHYFYFSVRKYLLKINMIILLLRMKCISIHRSTGLFL